MHRRGGAIAPADESTAGSDLDLVDTTSDRGWRVGTARVGISGWRYPPWRGVFYPEGLAQRAELTFASERMDTIEINGSFYSLQRPSSWLRWYEQSPDDFVFAVKGPRFITHLKRLRDARVPLANFFASGVLALREKLGPCLWQLPPTLEFDPASVSTFLAQLPRDTEQARLLAATHDDRMAERTWFEGGPIRRIDHVFEVRHQSFVDDRLTELLSEHGVALVIADSADRWPLLELRTAPIAYLRLHGDRELYVSGYSAEALEAWAAKILALTDDGLDVFVYFDNDAKVHAPFDAIALIELLREHEHS